MANANERGNHEGRQPTMKSNMLYEPFKMVIIEFEINNNIFMIMHVA